MLICVCIARKERKRRTYIGQNKEVEKTSGKSKEVDTGNSAQEHDRRREEKAAKSTTGREEEGER